MIITIPVLAAVIAILGCLYGSYTDLKRGIIPNRLTFPLIGLGLILNGIYAAGNGDWWFILSAVVITAVIFALGYLFWRMGAWAGGDVKLFTALAALIPFYPVFINYTLLNIELPMEAGYPFPFTVIINSILSILPFLLIYVIYISFKTKPHLLGELSSPLKDYKKNLMLTMVVTAAVTLTLLITPFLPYQVILISLILVYLFSFIISKLPNPLKMILVVAVTLFALYQNLQLALTGIVILFISITLVQIIRKLLTKVSREALQDDYRLNDLKEGMIPVYNVYQGDDEIYMDKKSFFDRMKEVLKTADISRINPPKDQLLISNMAAGLSKDNLELLRKLKNEGKIEDKLRIKRGVPFAPSIFIGLLISLFIGDLAFIFIKVLNWLL